jgi:hypothetical protein
LKSRIAKEFLSFIEKEIDPAIIELEKIKTEQSRKHLQKLVYTNVVNRYDVLVDNMLLTCAADDTTRFHDVVLGKLEGVTVSLKDFYRTMLSESPSEYSAEALRETVRANHLRERHSKKLRYLLEECVSIDRSELNKPRVNANDGRIHATYTARKGTTVPPSIVGYADYLYSRRNALVHGGKTNYLKKNDSDYIKKNFKVTPPKTVGIKIASIKSASTFYKYLCNYIINEKWPDGRGF